MHMNVHPTLQQVIIRLFQYVTQSDKTGLIAYDSKFDFLLNTKLHQYTIKFQCNNQQGFSTLLLLAAFIKPSGKPHEQSGALMELWPTRRWLCVTVQLHGDG